MNKHVHRLVFDRRRGMRVPAAEHVRSAGKAGSGESRSPARGAAGAGAALLSFTLVMLPSSQSWAQTRSTVDYTRSIAASMQRAANQAAARAINNLPVRSTDAARLKQDFGKFNVRGDLGADGHTMTIDQSDRSVIINWDSFDVGQGYTVLFNQPTQGSALNNIWSANPSVILGHIKANGEVILQNQNGVIFGPTARVDTGRFVATALSLTNDTFKKGLRAVQNGTAVFGSDSDTPTGFITIERGAEIKTLAGGDVIMVAPKVFNEGRIETPSGQTILAAGQKVYLYANTADTIQRGLIVAVDAFATNASTPAGVNTVEQAAAGSYATRNGETVTSPTDTTDVETKINQIIAEKGTINLVGMTVRQNGVLSATTAVKGQNGAIFLQAMKDSVPISADSGPRLANNLGTVELGSNSITSVTPDTGSATQTSSEAFYRSRINIDGKDIRVRDGALVQAVSGNIQMRASANAQNSSLFYAASSSTDDSTLIVDGGATLTAAGLRDVLLPMSRNQLSDTLFQIELADSPVQRNGVVYRKTVFADARKPVTLANVSGYYNLIGRTADELSIRGGNILLASSGKTVVADTAKLSIAGGSVRYEAGQLMSSLLGNSNGVVSLENADPNTRYHYLITPDPAKSTLQSIASYAEGADAGNLSVLGSSYYMGGSIDGSVVVGPLQRTGLMASEFKDASGAALPAYTNVYSTTSDSSKLDDELGWATILKTQPWRYASLRPTAGTLALGEVAGPSGGSFSVSRIFDDAVAHNDIHIVASATSSVGSVPELGTTDATNFFASLSSDVQLSAQQVAHSGLGNLYLAGKTVSMDADASFNLGASGVLTAEGREGVTLSGKVYAEGGKVTARVVETPKATLVVSPGAVIDVSGRQADERSGHGDDGVKVDGGSISLVASGTVDVRGADLDVSGGMLVSAASRTLGSAGSISLTANQGAATADRQGQILLADSTLSGYDFGSGGKLSLSGMRTLAIGAVPTADQSAWSSGLVLDEGFFSNGGFGSFSLKAIGDVKVFDNTHVSARIQNLYAPVGNYLPGMALASLTRLTLADGLRSGIKLSLTAAAEPDMSTSRGGNEFAAGAGITVGKGAVVDAGLGGAINLVAGLKVDVAGDLVAHGGQIALALVSGTRANTAPTAAQSTNTTGYVPQQEIRLRAGSLLDVSGAAKVVENQATHARTGSVLAGGSVTLGSSGSASGGSIFTEAGSVIDVSGAADTLNIGAGAVPVVVKQGAGSVTLNTADGFVLEGALKANRPDATVQGGSFRASVSLVGANDLVDTVGTFAKAYPKALHEVRLLGAQQDVLDYLSANTLFDGKHAIYGLGLLSTTQLNASGFDRIVMSADDRLTLGKGANITGPLADASQAMLRSVALNSRVLAVDDGQSHLIQAGRVALGSADLVANSSTTELAAAQSASGKGVLDVQAGLIEVNGYVGLSGIGSTTLDATLSADQRSLSRQDGEIRLIGRTVGTNASSLQGQLNFAGDLTLKAGSVYATTLSAFTINGTDSASHLMIMAPDKGSTASQPLTALAQLSLRANNIDINGVIDQSFGQIDVQAVNQLTLGAQARLSVSGDGLVVPVGTTLNGVQWSYNTQGTLNVTAGQSSVQSLDGLSLLKNISLKGGTLSVNDQVVVSAKSGGDLRAWEFVNGVGGSVDELNKAGYYAVLPGYKYDFAPYDSEIMATQKAIGTTLNAGDQVTVKTGSSVLAAGTYTLLPARYALLPGAVLVQVTSLKGTGTLAQAATRDDGSVLAAGYVGSAGSDIGSSALGKGLILVPWSTLQNRSNYLLSSINDYKAAQAAQAGTTADLASNAGRVQMGSDRAFDVAAHFDLNGGGELDLYMGQKMAVVDSPAQTLDGYASVNAKTLAASGADRVLLGGMRDGTVGNAVVTAMSDEVRWATSVDTTSELISVAKGEVSVADGVMLLNSGAADEKARSLTFKGQGAALALTNNINTTIKRDLSGVSSTTVTGDLVMGKGVHLGGQGVVLDVTGKASLPSDLAFSAPSTSTGAQASVRSVSLGANQLLVGADSSDASVLSLNQTQLNAMKGSERLSLRASTQMALSGALALGDVDAQGQPLLRSLTLDAPNIVGTGAKGDQVVLTARDVTLANSSAGVAASSSGQSDLVIVSKPVLNDTHTGGIHIGGNQDQRLAFNSVTMDTTGDVIIDGQSSTLSTPGDLTIKAARVTGTRLAAKTLKSDGKLVVAAVTADRHTLNESVGAGAALTLQAQQVMQAGRIDLASGQLNVQASGADGSDAVVFADGSVTSVAGQVKNAGTNWKVSTGGGNISATAQNGRVLINGQLDVSAAPVQSASDTAKSAGEVLVSAVGAGGGVSLGANASVLGKADQDALSGKLSIDTLSLSGAARAGTAGTLDRVAELAAAGQMASEVDLRIRQGDQSLGTTLHAQRVSLAADGGSMSLLSGATIDATSPQGGVVAVSARDDVNMQAGAAIKANSSRAGANGGDVMLSTTSGTIHMDPAASITAGGDDAQDGRIVLRAGLDQTALAAGETDPAKLLHVAVGDATRLSAGEVTVEAVQVFTQADSPSLFASLAKTSASGQVNSFLDTAASGLMDQADALKTAMGFDKLTGGQGHLRFGAELRTAGDFKLGGDWNLSGLRPGGEPIALTIRAGGNLTVAGNISDGFDGAVTGQEVAVLPGAAASMRLVAGADLSGASPFALKPASGGGDLTVGAAKMVRTTGGSIELAAAHDIVLTAGSGKTPTQATVYVAGQLLSNSDSVYTDELPTDVAMVQFTEHGGRLDVQAGHDIKAPAPTQLPGNWLYHAGGRLVAGTESWWVGFDSFKQGFGSFGGGNVHVQAQGNIVNVGVVAPSSAADLSNTVSTTDSDGNPVDTTTYARWMQSGGDVTVKAGGNIQGGVFLLGDGLGVIKSGGSIDKGTADATNKLAGLNPVLALMDGQAHIESRSDLNMGFVYDPTIAATNARAGDFRSYFYTYGADSALYLSSAAGGASWGNSDVSGWTIGNAAANWHNLYAGVNDRVIPVSAPAAVSVAPPIVRIEAGGGDLTLNINIKGDGSPNLVLFPSAQGDLSLYSAGTLQINGLGVSKLVMANTDPATWPMVGTSVTEPSYAALPKEIAGVNALVQTGSLLHQDDKTPVRIYAANDLIFSASSAEVSLSLPKAAEIEAGGDIVNPGFRVQHYAEQDRSLVRAGGDILGADLLSDPGLSIDSAMVVSGPGELRVEAGRDLNLRRSSGVLAIGNIENDALPNESAKLSLLAGGNKQLAFADFQRLYLDGNPVAQADLLGYVRSVLNLNGSELGGAGAYDQAVALYQGMSVAHQVAFADQLIQGRFVAQFVADGQPYAAAWQKVANAAGVSVTDYGSNAFLRFKNEVLMSEVTRLGKAATAIADSTDAAVNASNQARRQLLWDELNQVVSLAGLGKGFTANGNIYVASSKAQTRAPGSKTVGGIDLYAPGGDIVVGLTTNDSRGSGVVTQAGGSVRAVLEKDFQVNSQKAFVVGTGDLTIYADVGSIDSGRGSNTSVSAPQAVGRLVNGYLTFEPGAVTTGSGLAVLKRPDGTSDGDVNLFAPVGGILALDTYIRNQSGSGSVNLAGPVKGADNIKANNVSSTAVIAPAAAPIAVANTQPVQATAAGQDAATSGRDASKARSGLLTVELMSMGSDAPAAGSSERECSEDDPRSECVKKKKP